jgi:hypothetical protein
MPEVTSARYRTFTRSIRHSCVGSKVYIGLTKARTVDTGLTYDEARRACEAFNKDRTPRQIKSGTKMEFSVT